MFLQKPRSHGGRRGARSAFTLVELIVVVSIMLVIAALAVSAAFRVAASQQVKNTTTLIAKLDRALNQQWQAVIDQSRTETIDPNLQNNLAGGDARRARVIYIKLRLMQEFPCNFYEALGLLPGGGNNTYFNYVGGPKDSYVKALTRAFGSTSNVPAPMPGDAQGAVCLYLSLNQARRGMNFDRDTSASTSEAVPSPWANLNMFADAWGTPLGFFRWPAYNTELNPPISNPATATANPFADAQDPEGTLTDPGWFTTSGYGSAPSTNATNFMSAFHPLPLTGGVSFPTPQSYKLPPVIASFGPNTRPGLNDYFMTPASSGDDNDNIYNYRLRLGGRGD